MANQCRYCAEPIAEPTGRTRPARAKKVRVGTGQESFGFREAQPVSLIAPEPVDDDLFCALPRPCRYAYVGKVAAVQTVVDQHRSLTEEPPMHVQGALF